jgi:hypothetical protein
MKTILLGVTVMIGSLLFSGCGAAGTTAPSDLLPQAVKDQIIAGDFEPENHRNVQLSVTGEATILPYEKDQGIEKAVCLKIRYEKKVAADHWAAGTNSRIVQQKGNEWIVNNALLAVEKAWSQHSCLDIYESVVPQ